MAWTVSVRTRRKIASSAMRANRKVDIDASAKLFQLARSYRMHALAIAVQLCVLIAALMHISQAPVLAAVAIFGAMVSLANTGRLRGLDACRLDLGPAQQAEDSPSEADKSTPANEAGIRKFVSADHLGTTPPVVSPTSFACLRAPTFDDIAPANDAAAWAGLCARLSHELRTPLNAVLGFSELMKEELHGPLGLPRYREYVSHIRESGQALLKSTEDTLAITAMLSNSRDQNATAFRGLTVEPLLTDAWHFVEPAARARSVRFELDVQPNLQVLADQRALRQALINLLEEAICHAADGGCIAVKATVERGLVELEIKSGACQPPRLNETLPVTLAKALLEFSGCKLQIRSEEGRWRARASLDRAAQPDFFEELSEVRTATA